MLKFVAATKQHVKQLCRTGLRASDIKECRAMDCSPKSALKESWKASRYCWAALDHHDRPVAIFGVAQHPTDDQLGIPWMLASCEVYLYRRAIIEFTPKYVERMHKAYPRLANVIHVESKRSIRWLKWAGFTVSPPRPHGPKGELFHLFYRSR